VTWREIVARGTNGSVEFRILGPLELQDGRRPVSIRAPKERALLGVLLLHPNEAVSTERLIDELWGERPPATAGKIVQTYVSQLRRRFGPELIETRPPGYLVPIDDGALDASRFRRLTAEARKRAERGDHREAASLYREALALWRGSPLAGVTFESFARNEVDRLDGERLKALSARIDCELELGLHEELVPELESLVAQHPLQERLRAQLMLALYRSGRQADALAAYQDGRRTLVGALGLEPGPELHELERAILQQDPALQAPRQAISPLATVRRHWALVAIAVAATASALAVLGLVARGGPSSIPPNSVGVIDPKTNELVAEVPVGIGPEALAVGAGAIWATNTEDRTVSRIDPRTREVRNYSVTSYPSDVAAGPSVVWVALGLRALVSRIAPQQAATAAARPIPAGLACGRSTASIALEGRFLWFACESGDLARLNTETHKTERFLLTSSSAVAPRLADIAFGLGSLWIANRSDNSIIRLDPATGERQSITVGEAPSAIAIDYGSVWVTTFGSDSVYRIEIGGPTRPPTVTPIPVGDGPVGIATDHESVWVADGEGRSVSRIDPRRNQVVATIPIGVEPAGIAAGDGGVWVSARAPSEDER
jgi:YVTN family beta-propeller protein